MWVEDEGEARREEASREAHEEWLSGPSDEERDEYIAEEEYLPASPPIHGK